MSVVAYCRGMCRTVHVDIVMCRVVNAMMLTDFNGDLTHAFPQAVC